MIKCIMSQSVKAFGVNTDAHALRADKVKAILCFRLN